jgi:hypothetical protein
MVWELVLLAVLFAASLKDGIFMGIGKRGLVFLPLDRHVIITGPTRSGKTSLAKKIIKRARLPALVLDLSMELPLRSPTTCLEEGGNLSGGLRRKPQQVVAQKQRPVTLMKHAAPQKTMNCPNRYSYRHNYACEQAPVRRVGLRRALERLSCGCRLTGIFTPASQHLGRSTYGERAVADCEGR